MRMHASRSTRRTAPLLLLLHVSLVVIVACGGSQAPIDDSLAVTSNSTDMGLVEPAKPIAPKPPGQSREPTAREARVIDELMRSAEQVRHLRFNGPVPVLVQDRERITAYVETRIEDDELARAHTVYTALGLLDANADVRGMLLRLMGEQIVGYYDAKEKHLSVRDDVMRAFARSQAREDKSGFEEEEDEQDELIEARIVLVHELVHALQDQNLGLSTRIEEKRDTDAENAFHALVEGDATLAMIGHALEREGIPLHRVTGNPAQVRSFPDLVRQSPLAGSELEQAPAIVRVPLLSAYVDGLSFCASLHGAADWAGVDRAYSDPPISTEQILHPERFARRDYPTPLALPPLPDVAEQGYEFVREDTLGELETRVYFSQAGTEDAAVAAADGWDGDRLRVYEKPGAAAAVVWVSAWDSLTDAQQAERAAKAVQDAGSPAVRLSAEVVRRDQTLLIVRGLPEPLRAGLRRDFIDGKLGRPLAAGIPTPAVAPVSNPALPTVTPEAKGPSAHGD